MQKRVEARVLALLIFFFAALAFDSSENTTPSDDDGTENTTPIMYLEAAVGTKLTTQSGEHIAV